MPGPLGDSGNIRQGVAIGRGEILVEIGDTGRGLQGIAGHRDGDVIQGLPQPRLAGAQLFLDPPALGDVLEGAGEVGPFQGVLHAAAATQFGPELPPRAGDHANLQGKRCAGLQRPGQGGAHFRQRLWRIVLKPLFQAGRGLIQRMLHQPVDLPRPEQPVGGGIGLPATDLGDRLTFIEESHGLGQPRLLPFPLADVVDNGLEQGLAAQLKGVQADLGVELRTVGPGIPPFEALRIAGFRLRNQGPGHEAGILPSRLQGGRELVGPGADDVLSRTAIQFQHLGVAVN